MKKYLISKILIFTVLISLAFTVQLNAQDVYRKVDIMPEFPGGQVALSQFITKNIQWPSTPANSGLEGTVYVTFVVETDGTLTQIKALKAFNEAYEIEAENVVKKMPKWSPGKNDGTPVRVMLSLPIEFMLKK